MAPKVAQAFAELPPPERKEAIKLVPKLLRIDEAFVLCRRRQALRGLLAGRTVPAQDAVAQARAK